MMSDEPNDTAVATSPDPTEEVDAAGAADAECAAPVEAVPVEAALNPADEVDQLKAELARRVNQPASKLSFLEPLPPELLRNICETFDEAGTKDGKMLQRLEAYTRSIARRNHLTLEPPSHPSQDTGRYGSAEAIEKRVEAFVHDLDMDENTLDLILSLEHKLQIEVIEQFEVEGTRDGNVQNRFFSFVRGVWLRALGVSREVGDLIKDCPEELQADIIKNFDPKGTKDGNLSARLQSFATLLWRNSKTGRAYKKQADWNLDVFVKHWGLEPWALKVLRALPPEVQEEVLNGFDVSSTRDGYIAGRFLGYVRSKWARHLELDEQCCYAIKRLPQEGQVMCITQFDPRSTRDGNVSARMRGFLWKVDAQLNDAAYPEEYSGWRGRGFQDHGSRQSYDSWGPARHEKSYSYESFGGYQKSDSRDSGMRDAILKFVARWDLDLAVGVYLEKLKDPDVVARVLEEFDPSGTQDGNVLFRLKSFVRLLCSRRKRGELHLDEEYQEYQEPQAPSRLRKEKWQKKPHT